MRPGISAGTGAGVRAGLSPTATQAAAQVVLEFAPEEGVFQSGGAVYTTEGEAFEIELSAPALGTDVVWTKESGDLPTGVSFTDNEDGTAKIHGTPAAAASPVAILVRATKANGKKAEKTINLGVAEPAPEITTTTLPDMEPDEPYASGALAATGGKTPLAWSLVATDVPGLSINASTGELSVAEAPAAATYSVTVRVTDAFGRTATAELVVTSSAFDPVTAFDDLAAHFLGGSGETKSGDDVTAWANRGTDDLSVISDGTPPESLADADGDGAAGLEFINAEKLRLYNAAGDTARTTGHLFTASEKLVVAEIVSNTPGSNGGTIVGDAADWWHFLDKGGSSDLEFANYEGGYDVAAVARDVGNLQLLAYKHVSGEQYVSANGGAWQKKDDSGDTGAVGNACYFGYAYSYNNCDHRLIRLATNDVVPVDIDERLAALAAYRGLS